MPDEKAPSSGAFLPASLMYFCSGEPMHFLSGVDTRRDEEFWFMLDVNREAEDMSGRGSLIM
jgi:hypothetical protein